MKRDSKLFVKDIIDAMEFIEEFMLTPLVKVICLKQKNHAPRDFLHALKDKKKHWEY